MSKLFIILSSTWKFALTFPFAVYVSHMSFAETLLYTNIGGILGALFFTYLWGFLIKCWNIHLKPRLNYKRKESPVFTRKRRLFVKIKSKYGFPGIVILNPVILSIPISAFLISKYYGKNKLNLIWLIFGQFVWSLIYTYFYIHIRKSF